MRPRRSRSAEADYVDESPPPERDEAGFFAPPAEVLRDEVEALLAADLVRLAGPEPLFWLVFEALDLAPDFDVSDFVEAAAFDGALRAGERDADLVEALFEAVPDFVGALFDAAPDFDALFDAAPDFDAPLAAAPIPDFDAPAPVLVAAFLLLGVDAFDAAAVFFVPLDAPPELDPDLRDFVVLSAIIASFRRSRDAVTLAEPNVRTSHWFRCSAAAPLQ